jgi:hypothetical protein
MPGSQAISNPPAHDPELCGLDGGPHDYPARCPGCLHEAAQAVPSAPPPQPSARHLQALAEELRAIADRWGDADRRTRRAPTPADRDAAELERWAIAGEYRACRRSLAALFLMLLRITVEHDPQTLRQYLAKVSAEVAPDGGALEPEPAPAAGGHGLLRATGEVW